MLLSYPRFFNYTQHTHSHFLFCIIVCLLLKVCSVFISQIVQQFKKLCFHSFHSTVVQSGYGNRKASATTQMEGIECYQLQGSAAFMHV